MTPYLISDDASSPYAWFLRLTIYGDYALLALQFYRNIETHLWRHDAWPAQRQERARVAFGSAAGLINHFKQLEKELWLDSSVAEMTAGGMLS